MNSTVIQQLQIKEEVRELMARYVRYADEKNWSQLAALFTPDGSFTPLNVQGNILTVMNGRKEIEDTINKSVGNATAIHHLFSYEIALTSEQTASGIFSMEDYLIRPENEPIQESSGNIPAFRMLHGYGHYHGEYIKTDARWYISKLVQTRIKLDFTI